MNRAFAETSRAGFRWRTIVVVLGLLVVMASGPALANVFSEYVYEEFCGCWVWWPDI